MNPAETGAGSKRAQYEHALEIEAHLMGNEELAERVWEIARYRRAYSAAEQRAYLKEAATRLQHRDMFEAGARLNPHQFDAAE